MECLYEFECQSCGNHFDEFVERSLAENKDKKASVVEQCPACGGDAHILPVQLVGHGQNHSSWSVKCK